MLVKARFRFPEVLFGVLLAVAIFAMGMTFGRSYYLPSAQNNNGSGHSNGQSQAPYPSDMALVQPKPDQTSTQGGQREKSAVDVFFELKLTDVIIAIFTVVLAVKTSGLFVETAGLRAAADKQREDSLRAIEATENSAAAAVVANTQSREFFTLGRRPWLELTSPRILIDGGGNLIFQISCKNIGQTLARDVEAHIQVTRSRLVLWSNRIVEEFVGGISDSGFHKEFTSNIYPSGVVQISNVSEEMPAGDDRSCRLVFCVTYQADGIAALLKVAGEITFSDTIVGETDEEGWGAVHFHPHNFRVTYAD